MPTTALALTIQTLFGDEVEHRQCEWHLGRKLRQHLPDEILTQRTHPITIALLDAFCSLERWDRLEHAIRAEHTSGEHRPLGLAIKWLDTYGQIARGQIPIRDPNGLNSTGPVEQVLREIDRWIGCRLLHQPHPAGQAAQPHDPRSPGPEAPTAPSPGRETSRRRNR